MSLQTDISLGYKKETVFGTAVTVDRFPEITEESLLWQPNFGQGKGFRVGSTIARRQRRVLLSQQAGGSFGVELGTKGMGGLFEAALGGSPTNTIIPGSTGYQQVFTPATDDFLPSYSIQKALPMLGAGATRSAMTFLGSMCSGFTLSSAMSDIVKLTLDWIAREVKTDVALATTSYAAGLELLTFIHGSITVGGAVTPATATALASGGNALANIRDFNLTYANNLDGNGMTYNSGGKLGRKKALGERGITGTVTAEYTDNTLRDAYLNQTDLALVMTFASLVPITAGVFPTVQFVIPGIALDSDLPTANGGDVIATGINFTALDLLNGAAPFQVVIRTSDTSI